jgi:hypothetical protein
MRNKLLVSVATTALIASTAMAAAQAPASAPESNKATPGAAQHQTTPGATQHQATPGGGATQPGGAMKPSGGAAQNAPAASAPEQKQTQGQGQERPGLSQNKPMGEEHGNTSTQRGAQSGESNKATGTQSGQAQRGEPERNQGTAQGQPPVGAPSNEHAQGTTPGRAPGANVQLSEQQRTQIRGVIVKDRSAARVEHPDFDVRVGVTVPRTVHVATLPVEVVTIVPQYRGFDYVLVGDALLIIDPHTMEIVAVLPA